MTEKGHRARPDVLGAYIRAQRQLADLSLRQLADMSKVSNAYLSQIERGLHQPSVRILQSIAGALNLSGETLLAEAGILDPDLADPAAGVEKAVMADADLTDEEKHVLVGIYRNFRQRHE
jgi:transcriptional regulator with XRE-family HTH domain